MPSLYHTESKRQSPAEKQLIAPHKNTQTLFFIYYFIAGGNERPIFGDAVPRKRNKNRLRLKQRQSFSECHRAHGGRHQMDIGIINKPRYGASGDKTSVLHYDLPELPPPRCPNFLLMYISIIEASKISTQPVKIIVAPRWV